MDFPPTARHGHHGPVTRTDRLADVVAVIGAESTGKTTLATDLARSLRARCVMEELREWVQSAGRLPGPADQAEIAQRQALREEEAADGGLVVSDAGPIMTAVYSRWYFSDESLHPAAIARWHRYRVVLWCRTDLPWVPDRDLRDGPGVRAGCDAIIADWARRDRLPVVSLAGDRATRLRTALDACR